MHRFSTRPPRSGHRLVRLARTLLAPVAAVALVAASGVPASAWPHSSGPAGVDPEARLHVPAHVTELPVPPTAPSADPGSCTAAVNPRGTGCVSPDWGALGSPGFYWDPHFVLLGAFFAGAPGTGPSSAYSGQQVLLVRTDGRTFANGDAWKCLTCGVALGPDIITGNGPQGGNGQSSGFQYPPPHALPGDTQALVGNGILSCGAYRLDDPRCTPEQTHVYPIYWGDSPLGGVTGHTTNGREWRLSPDGVHLAWSQLVISPTLFYEYTFMGRLAFDEAQQRYDLTNVSELPNAAPYQQVPGTDKLKFVPRQMIGEFRGWTNDGKGILGIQSAQSDNVDAWSTSLATGDSTLLTNHAEYTDPMFMSPNGKWLLANEVLGSGRLDFISGMQGIPPITDQLPTTGYVSGIRNNGMRRFFLPWLVRLDAHHGKGRITRPNRSEQVNLGADPNWNAAADPVWLADSTGVVWSENLACGANPQPHQCPDSTEPGARNSRVMIARFPVRPSRPAPPAPVSDTVPWGHPYTYGDPLPPPAPMLPVGTYTVDGKLFGTATVVVTGDATTLSGIAVTYHFFSDVPGSVINGSESVALDGASPFTQTVTWHENLYQFGRHFGAKLTGPAGFTLGPSVLLANNFQPTGSMTTTIDGRTFTQPANGT